MGPDLTETPRASGCPSCGAALRPDAPWCTLCYADLRPKPAAGGVPSAVRIPSAVPAHAAYGLPSADPLTAPLRELLPRQASAAEPGRFGTELTWPCTECAATNPLAAPSCGVCGAGFLASVAEAGRPSLVVPVLGDLGRLSRGQRMAAAFGAVALLVAPLALLTVLLTGSPPKSSVGAVLPQPSVPASSPAVGAP